MAASKKFKNLSKIKLVCLDVDGVLTDGGIIIGNNKTELKQYDVKDGTGIALGRHAGLQFAVISGRFSKAIAFRAKELKIQHVYQGALNKLGPYAELKEKLNLKDEEICFIGDEIIDIPVLRRCGFGAAPADSASEAKKASHYICKNGGGRGCVREVIDMVLKARGLWDTAVKRYLNDEKEAEGI